MSGNKIYQYFEFSSSEPEKLTPDLALAAPRLLAPADGQRVCPPSDTGGTASNVILSWTDTGASNYVLQWSLSSSFQGPTVQAIETGDNFYNLALIDDIRMGDKIHWRVCALDGSGNVSPLSETWECEYRCQPKESRGDGTGATGGPPAATNPSQGQADCEKFNVEMDIHGPKNVMCCDKVTFKLNMSWDCKQDNEDLAELINVTWSIIQDPTDNGVSILSSDATQATCETDCANSQLTTIQVTAEFEAPTADGTGVQTFFCQDQHQFFVDCDTGLPAQKPWLQRTFDYVGDGVQTYLDPDYWAPTIAPAYGMTTIESTEGVFVMYPPSAVGTDGVKENVGDVAYPDGFPVTHVMGQGPVARFGSDQLYKPPAPPGSRCNPVDDMGYPTGEQLEARTHLAIACGLEVGNHGLKIRPDHIVGQEGFRRGLETFGDCSIQVDYGCGLKIYEQELAVDREDLRGKGLYPSVLDDDPSCCKMDVYLGCGLKFPESPYIVTDECLPEGERDIEVWPIDIDAEALAGTGLGGSGCSLSVSYGCGLTIDDEIEGSPIRVYSAALAGDGLGTNESVGNCEIYINAGCGLDIIDDELVFDSSGVAGDGLTTATGTQCELEVDTGCGLKLLGGEVVVNNLDLYGDFTTTGLLPDGDCGLKVYTGCTLEISSDGIRVDTSAIAGDGLKPDGACELAVDEGCGLMISGGQLTIDRAALIGPGLYAFGSGCAIGASPGGSISYGCGLDSPGGTLQVNSSDLYGDPNTTGLTADGDCGLKVYAGCGLDISTGGLGINRDDIMGQGLMAGDGDCDIDVDISGLAGCGLYESDGILNVDNVDLVGDVATTGLEVDGDCGLKVAAACGLEISSDGVRVKPVDLAGPGLQSVGGSDVCELTIDYGCGLEINDTTLEVKADDLAGDGLEVTTDCELQVNTGCGLEISAGEVRVNPSEVAGDGLTAAPTGCAIDIDAGCGLHVTGGQVRVQPTDLAGPGLGTSGVCGLEVNTGCGLEISSDAVRVKASDLAGAGLSSSGACQLDIDYGCGLDAPGGTLEVKASDLASTGGGLSTSGSCGLQVDAGCGINVDATGVNFNASDAAGNGLSGSGCSLSVGAGCGINVTASSVEVNASDLAGAGLSTSGSCGLAVGAGCGITVSGSSVAVDTTPSGNVGTWWGIVPGSLNLTVSGCTVTAEVQRQSHTLQKNACGVVLGNLSSGGAITDTASASFSTYHRTWEVYDCSQQCVTIDIYEVCT